MFHSPSPHRARRGASLIETLVALVILSITALAVGSGAQVIRRISLQLDSSATADLARENTLRLAQHSPGCLDGGAPRIEGIVFPAAARRPALTAAIRCGR